MKKYLFTFLILMFIVPKLFAQDTVRSNDLQIGAYGSTIYLLELAPDTNVIKFPYFDNNLLIPLNPYL